MSKSGIGPNQFTDEEQQQIDRIVGKIDSQGINWQRWAYSTLKEAILDALASGADYIGLRCPRCHRVRLMPESTAVNRAKLTCEKCGWNARLKV